MSDPPAEVRERLLRAWRGEITAGAVYDLIARRMNDREAEILRRMAQPRGDGPPGGQPREEGPPLAVPGARARLDRILGREKWHRTGGGWISGAIYGANDGLAAVFGIVAGVSGATGGSSSVLTAGLAGAIASALSMATGAFLAERSEAEVVAANIERERQQIATHPDEEREELSLFYQLKGSTRKPPTSFPRRWRSVLTPCWRPWPPRSSGRARRVAATLFRPHSRRESPPAWER